MKPYGRIRRQSSHSPHGAECRICYPDMSKQEGRRKAREAGKEECVNDQQFKMDEFKVRQALEMARADLCFAVNYGDMPQSYCMRLGSTVEYITEVLGDHDEFTKLFGEWKTI